MSHLSTHVLDTAAGRPAAGIVVRLEAFDGDGWHPVASATTDTDGRVTDLLHDAPLRRGEYRLTFEVGAYLGPEAFYPEAVVVFRVGDPEDRYHIPLLLSPYGYTTYRGS
jgi:5-hydroxyisourate hydrolase